MIMKRFKSIFKYSLGSLFALSTLFITSSCNFLNVDEYFADTMPFDSIFHNKKNLTGYMWGTASQFPDEGSILSGPYTPGPLATDEGFVAFSTSQFSGMGFVLGEVTPDDLKHMNTWSSMYKIVRKSNTILKRMDEAVDLSPADKFEIMGYTHFMRGYAYYNVLMNFGPVIITEEVLKNNEDASYYNTNRATYDESVDYICNEFEEAAKYLPEKVLISNFGRPTKGAAYGLIARLRLQQASPLFNGGAAARSYFGSWQRKIDNAHYVSQIYDEKKWAVAAAAAKRVMDMNLYELYTVDADGKTPALPASVPSAHYPDGAGGIDHFRSYSEIFTGEAVPQTNPEFVWARMSGPVKEMIPHSFNFLVMGGWNGMCLTQKVVDAYRMVDGREINNSSAEYPYSEVGSVTSGGKTFSGYVLNNRISNMYANREMRFYASVGFSRRFWSASSTSETNRKNLTITYDRSGNSGRYSSDNVNADYPATGYVITKFIHENDACKGTGSTILDKAFPMIRYAEILLSYAEALNNLTTTHTVELPNGSGSYTVSRNVAEISKGFNRVRFRAGLPGLTSTELSSSSTVQKLIEQERMVEFLFENRRFFDVRRWGIYESTEKEPIMGMDLEADEPQYYSRVIVNHPRVRNRIVDRKMIFLPILRSEIRKVPNLDQNPGWGN